jgi:hypothetical protein
MSRNIICALLIFCHPFLLRSQEAWPRILQATDGSKISIYQPQPEKLHGNIITGRTAVSVKQKTAQDPVFGAIWFTAEMETNRDNRMAVLQKLKISNIRIPGVEDSSKINDLKMLLETEAPKWKLNTTLDEIAVAVEQEQDNTVDDFKNEPPLTLYTTKYTALVLIDGEPKWQTDDKLKMKRVINSAFLFFSLQMTSNTTCMVERIGMLRNR